MIIKDNRLFLLCVCAAYLFGAPLHGQTLPKDSAVAIGTVPNDFRPLTSGERWNLYWHGTFQSPKAFFRAAGPALGGQLNNEPPSWGQGMEGYSKRFSNRFGRYTLKETYEALGAAALRHEVRYLPSRRSGFLPRLAHALSADFVTSDRTGRRRPHIARVGGVFAAEFTGNLWMPAGYSDASHAMSGVGMQLALGGASNVIREFRPELKRVFIRR